MLVFLRNLDVGFQIYSFWYVYISKIILWTNYYVKLLALTLDKTQHKDPTLEWTLNSTNTNAKISINVEEKGNVREEDEIIQVILKHLRS